MEFEDNLGHKMLGSVKEPTRYWGTFEDYKRSSAVSFNCIEKVYNYMFPRVQSVQRAVSLDGESYPKNYVKNLVRNQKYNIFIFLPVVLFNQFRFFYNLFYLCISITQFYPPLSIGKKFQCVSKAFIFNDRIRILLHWPTGFRFNFDSGKRGRR